MRQKKISQKTVCFVGGRSGGHIIPALTLARHYHATLGHAVLFFSTATPLDYHIIGAHSFVMHKALILGNVPYKKVYLYPLFLWQLIKAFFTSFYFLWRFKPAKVISLGGYISVPVCVAAKVLRVPIELYELNAVPGVAVRCLAPLARAVYYCFEQAVAQLPKRKAIFVQYPVRFGNAEKQISAQQARARLGLDSYKKTIFVLGGSQGSLFLNNSIQQWAQQQGVSLLEQVQIIHQIGKGEQEAERWTQFYRQCGVRAVVFTYNDALQNCYAAADIIVCRAGAGTLFEILFFGKPCIVIPLESKQTNHQVDNALALQKQYPRMVTVMRQLVVEKDIQTLAHALNSVLFPFQNGIIIDEAGNRQKIISRS